VTIESTRAQNPHPPHRHHLCVGGTDADGETGIHCRKAHANRVMGCRCDASEPQPAARPALQSPRRATLLGSSAAAMLSWAGGSSVAWADPNCVEMPALRGKGYCKPATIYPGTYATGDERCEQLRTIQ